MDILPVEPSHGVSILTRVRYNNDGYHNEVLAMRWVRLGFTVVLVVVLAAISAAQVSIVSPKDGETIRSRWVTVKVEKPSPEGYVMVWLNNQFVAAVSAPFELRIDLAERNLLTGSHTLRVVGRAKDGSLEGEAQVQFHVNLTGVGAGVESVQLAYKLRTGEIAFYTLSATSETKAEVPAKAIRQKLPQLSTKLTLRWFQTVRDITADRQFRMMRVVEGGVLEREAPVAAGAAPMMGGGPLGGIGGLISGYAGMLGSLMGEEAGAPSPMMGGMPMMPGAPMMPSAPMAPGAPTAGALQRLRLRPTDNQRAGLFTLLPDGTIVAGEELPSVVRFTAGNIDLAVPDRPLKIGDRWIGFVTLPRNIENLTIVGAAAPAGMMGGMPGGLGPGAFMGEEAGAPMGMPYGGAPYGMPYGGMPGAPMMPGRPGMGPSMPGAPMMPGMPPGMPGAPTAPQEPEALLADAPVVTAPATHRLDGFEYWNDRLCARIVSQFKVKVELDLGATTAGAGPMAPGAMGGEMGAPLMGGGPMMGAPGMGAPMMGGMVGRPGMPGAPTMGMPSGPGAQPFQAARRLSGEAEGTRTLLFDIESGQVVYVKVTMKATFDTDYATVLPLLPQVQQPAVTGAPGMPGAPMMPGGPAMPGGPMPGAPMMGGMVGRPGMAGAPMMPGAGGFSGEEAGAPAGMPYGGVPYGGAPYGGMPYGPTGPGMPSAPMGPGVAGMPGAPMGPGVAGMPGAPGAPGMGMPLQPTFRNHPAKLHYSLTLENVLLHLGRLDRQLKALTEAR